MALRGFFAKAVFVTAGLAIQALALGNARAADGPPPAIAFGVHKLMETNVEGPDVERTYFTIGKKTVIFGSPKGWRISAGDGFLLLPDDGTIDGEVHVTRSSFTPDVDLVTNVLLYRDSASRSLPSGAEGAQVQPPVMNPYPFNGWKSLGFIWNYGGQGRPMIRTVNYINLEPELGVQVMVTTLASRQDSAKVEKAAKQFMASWWIKGK